MRPMKNSLIDNQVTKSSTAIPTRAIEVMYCTLLMVSGTPRLGSHVLKCLSRRRSPRQDVAIAVH